LDAVISAGSKSPIHERDLLTVAATAAALRSGLRVGLWHGDIGAASRRKILEDPPEILLTTPESLEAMLLSVKTDHAGLFRHLRTVVVDEVHAFGGDDRGWHLLGVLERLSAVAGRDLQRIGLSATVGEPGRLLSWLVGGSTGPRQVIAPDVGPSATATEITLDHVGNLANAALMISRLHPGEKRLVFCDSRARVESLAAELRRLEVTTFVSHASLAVDERRRAEQAFAEGRNCVIVSTSTLELGIDVGDLDRVIQIDSPTTVASFLQRLGRTGRRAGSVRNMLLLTTDEGLPLLQAAGLLHLWVRGFVEPVEAPPLPLHLLAHQLLAYAIQEGRIGRHLWQQVLGGLPAYAAAIESGDADLIVDHLVETGMLVDDEGMLSVGPEGERSYGFRHFMELTSAFTSPPTFVVRHGATELGHLDPTSLLTNDRAYATVLLAGRSWKITSIDWKRHFAWVEPAEQHGRSRWCGTGRALSAELCDAMREVACGANPPGVILTQRAQGALADIRGEFTFARPRRTSVVIGPTSARWWTWAGLRANSTLGDALGDLVASRADDLSMGLDPIRANTAAIRERLQWSSSPPRGSRAGQIRRTRERRPTLDLEERRAGRRSSGETPSPSTGRGEETTPPSLGPRRRERRGVGEGLTTNRKAAQHPEADVASVRNLEHGVGRHDERVTRYRVAMGVADDGARSAVEHHKDLVSDPGSRDGGQITGGEPTRREGSRSSRSRRRAGDNEAVSSAAGVEAEFDSPSVDGGEGVHAGGLLLEEHGTARTDLCSGRTALGQPGVDTVGEAARSVDRVDVVDLPADLTEDLIQHLDQLRIGGVGAERAVRGESVDALVSSGANRVDGGPVLGGGRLVAATSWQGTARHECGCNSQGSCNRSGHNGSSSGSVDGRGQLNSIWYQPS